MLDPGIHLSGTIHSIQHNLPFIINLTDYKRPIVLAPPGALKGPRRGGMNCQEEYQILI